jgi:soluble lytic murein transglycosylase
MQKILKISLVILLPALIAAIAFIYKYEPDLVSKLFQSTEHSRNLYRKARQLQLNNDSMSAYYTYGQISSKYEIFDIVLFQQGNCAATLEDEKTAIKKYAKVLKSFPQSPVAPIASYNLGQAYLRYGEKLKAEEQFLTTIESFPGSDYALGSLYYLGELNREKDKKQAIEYWLKYIALVPSGRFAVESYEGLKSLNHQFSEKDNLLAGIALFMNQRYQEALEHFDKVPLEQSWYYSAMSNKGLNNQRKASSILKKGLSSYLDENTSEAKVKNAMTTYANIAGGSKYRSWCHILDWTTMARDFALYNKAQFLSAEKAKSIYEEIYHKYPEGQYASESLWNLFWSAYNSGNYDKAIELGQKHIASYDNTNASPAVYYWFGKIYEKKKDSAKAKKFYKTVLKRFPDSYYAFRANSRYLTITGKESDKKWLTSLKNRIPEKIKQPEFPYTYEEVYAKHGVQVAETIFLGDYETASQFMIKDPFIESWVKLQKDALTNSVVAARNGMKRLVDKPKSEDSRWKLIYPICYAQEINEQAVLNDLDPVLVISLIKEESHFNPFAVSSANARGLMQLLPATARDITRWKNLGNYRNSELFDPKVNIKVGSAYLGYTCDVFNKNMLFAIAAYNAGPAAVQTWVKRLPCDDLDRFIENIPYDQTRNYVKKIFGTYWNYKRIYGFN